MKRETVEGKGPKFRAYKIEMRLFMYSQQATYFEYH